MHRGARLLALVVCGGSVGWGGPIACGESAPPPAAEAPAAARVIADAGGTFAHSLLLNAGEREGARKGQAARPRWRSTPTAA